MQVVEYVQFWCSTVSQVAALATIYQYIDSSLPFCYRQHPSDDRRICITPNATTCYSWINEEVHWSEQGLTYRSSERICTSQFVWLMKSLVYVSSVMVGAQVIIRRKHFGNTPNGVAFAYSSLIATLSLFLLNYYMKNDWRTYWKTAGVFAFSNAIRHEPISYVTLFLITMQLLTFLSYFYQLYSKTWSKW